jgi:hypothetical protein
MRNQGVREAERGDWEIWGSASPFAMIPHPTPTAPEIPSSLPKRSAKSPTSRPAIWVLGFFFSGTGFFPACALVDTEESAKVPIVSAKRLNLNLRGSSELDPSPSLLLLLPPPIADMGVSARLVVALEDCSFTAGLAAEAEMEKAVNIVLNG